MERERERLGQRERAREIGEQLEGEGGETKR